MKDLIKQTKYFKDLDTIDYHAILRCFSAKLMHFKKDEVIISIGDDSKYIYIISDGEAWSQSYDKDGKKTIISSYIKNDIFGMEFLDLEAYQVELIAKSDVAVIACNKFRFITPCQNRCKRHIDCMKMVFLNMSSSLSKKDKRITTLCKSKTRDKIYDYLKNISKNKKAYFKIPFTQQELATYLGLERSALSAELNKMKKEGIIDFDLNMYKIIKK